MGSKSLQGTGRARELLNICWEINKCPFLHLSYCVGILPRSLLCWMADIWCWVLTWSPTSAKLQNFLKRMLRLTLCVYSSHHHILPHLFDTYCHNQRYEEMLDKLFHSFDPLLDLPPYDPQSESSFIEQLPTAKQGIPFICTQLIPLMHQDK